MTVMATPSAVSTSSHRGCRVMISKLILQQITNLSCEPCEQSCIYYRCSAVTNVLADMDRETQHVCPRSGNGCIYVIKADSEKGAGANSVIRDSVQGGRGAFILGLFTHSLIMGVTSQWKSQATNVHFSCGSFKTLAVSLTLVTTEGLLKTFIRTC